VFPEFRKVIMGKTIFICIILVSANTLFQSINGAGYQNNNFAQDRIIYVGGDGPANFSSINDALKVATDGDTIYVYSGRYHEHLLIDKSVKLIGENKNSTIIDGDGYKYTIKTVADGVEIKGFTITNSSVYCGGDESKMVFEMGGVLLASNSNKISDNIISGNACGICIGFSELDTHRSNPFIVHPSSQNLITNNTISSNSIGIFIDAPSKLNVILDNVIKENNESGITFSSLFLMDFFKHLSPEVKKLPPSNSGVWEYFPEPPNNNMIKQNSIINNIGTDPFATGAGILLFYSKNNYIRENTVTENNRGILICYSFADNISYNYIGDNDIGIDTREIPYINIIRTTPSNPVIFGNDIDNNKLAGVLLWKQEAATIANNEFKTNGIIIWGDRCCYWDNFTIENNFIDRKPLYYYKNRNGGNLSLGDAGQIILANCSNLIIQDARITTGVNVGLLSGFSSFNTIKNCLVAGSGCGIYLYCSSNNEIENSILTANWISIYLENSSNNMIRENSLEGTPTFSFTSFLFRDIREEEGAGIYIGKVSQKIIITNNKIKYRGGDGIYIDRCSNNIISNNLLTDSDIYLFNTSQNNLYGNIMDGGSINIISSSHNKIDRCTIKDSSKWGIRFFNSTCNTVTNSTIEDNKGNGILLEGGSSKNLITLNVIMNNGEISLYPVFDRAGILIEETSDTNTIRCNKIFHNKDVGIWVKGENNRIEENIIRKNIDEGIRIGGQSNSIVGNIICANMDGIRLEGADFNSITENFISNYIDVGISLIKSCNNTISGNTMWGNLSFGESHGTALQIVKSSNNRIKHNNFIMNKENLYLDDSENNLFIRNYWDRPRLLPYSILIQLKIIDIRPRLVPYLPLKCFFSLISCLTHKNVAMEKPSLLRDSIDTS